MVTNPEIDISGIFPRYTIRLGDFNCSQCGKKMKKGYFIAGNVNPYGSECAKELLGLTTLPAPPWVIAAAEAYVQYRFNAAKKLYDIEGSEDFTVNFFNEEDKQGITPWGIKLTHVTNRDGSARAYWEPIRIDGKVVKVDWQNEMAYYMVTRRMEELTKRGWVKSE